MRLIIGNRAGLRGVRIGEGSGDRRLDSGGSEPRGFIEEGLAKDARIDEGAPCASRRPGRWYDHGRSR
jgi:hypothetical protein